MSEPSTDYFQVDLPGAVCSGDCALSTKGIAMRLASAAVGAPRLALRLRS